MKSVATVVALSLAAAASAQLGGLGISQQCINTLTGAFTGPASQCLNLAGLVPLATANASTSLIQPIDSWLTGLCKADPCSNSTLSTLTTNITSGCSADLTSAGLTTSLNQSLPGLVQQYYTVGREVLCLEDTNNSNTLCVTSTLRTIEAALGAPLTISNAISKVPSLINNSTLVKTVECSQCVQGGWAILRKSLAAEIVSSGDAIFKSACGDSFISGGQPSNIKTTASGVTGGSSSVSGSATGSPSNAAGALAPFSFAASSVAIPAGMALAGVFAFVWTLA